MKTCLAYHHHQEPLRLLRSSFGLLPPGSPCRKQYSQETTMDPSSSSSSSCSSSSTIAWYRSHSFSPPTITIDDEPQQNSELKPPESSSSPCIPVNHGDTNKPSLVPGVQHSVGCVPHNQVSTSIIAEDLNLSETPLAAERPPSAESPCSARVRLMCSYGGRIMPRPGDGKLRYGGGETRMVAINRGIPFAEFMLKMAQFYGSPLGFKYQLPYEDLDALVSVSSDDDLQNMMEEYEKVESSGSTSSRIRLFFFTNPSELEVSPGLALDAEDGPHTSEQRFVNGFSAENLHMEDTCPHNLNELPSKGGPSSRGFEGNLVEPDVSGSSHRLWNQENYPFLTEQHNLERQMNGPTDPSRVSYHDHLISRQGMHHVDSLPSLTHQSLQIMEYRTSSPSPMDYHHDNPQQSSGTHLSHLEHQRLMQKQQQYIPQQQQHQQHQQHYYHHHPHHYSPQYIPQQQQHPWTMHIEPGSGRSEHGSQDVHIQTQQEAFHNQHYNYPSHHHRHPPPHSHLVVAGHDKSLRNGGYQNHTSLSGLYPQMPHGMVPAPPYQIDPPRVSIRDTHQARCPCGLQHALVHRGITVCIDEQSTASRWPGHIVGEQSLRKHAVFNSSRFSENRSSFNDNPVWPNHVGNADSEHREHMSHIPGQYMHQRNRPLDYSAESHSRNFLPRTPDSQEICQVTGGFDAVKQVGNKTMGNSGYYEKQDHMVKEGFPYQKAYEVDSGRLTRVLPNVQLPKDEDYRGGELTDEKCIDGQSILYRPHIVQGELESPLKRPGMLQGRRPPYPSGARPLVSDGMKTVQTLYTHGTERHPEYTTSLTTSVEMHDLWNNEHKVNPFSSRHLQVNEFRVVGSENHQEDTENLNVRSVLMSIDTPMTHEIVMASKRPVYDHGNIESESSDECKVSSPDASISPLEVIDAASAAARSPTIEGETCLDDNHVFEAVAHHVKHNNMPLTTLSIDSLGGIIASPTYDKSVIRMTKFSFSESEDGSLSTTEIDNIEKANFTSEVEDKASSVTIQSLDVDRNSNKELNNEHGAHDDTKADQIDVEKPLSSLTEKHESTTDVQLEEKADLESSCVISHQENGSQVEESHKEETKKPEEEARARGLQIIKNADLEDLKELGSGTFGTVYHGKWRGSDVAIKRIKSSCFSGSPSQKERLTSDFWKEACTLGQLHHPNVVAFYGVVPDGPDGTLATVTEYMVNGSLKQVLQKKDRTIDRRKRLVIAMDAAFGMEYLHSKNIVHFDLKCENLLVNMKDAHRPICKVGDFGLSKVKHQTLVSGGVRGTLPWMAPELLSGNSKMVTDKVDVYSFGIVMWELLTGEEPYASMQFGAIIRGIVDNTLRPSTPTWCDPGWRQLMEQCWSGNPEERPTFTEIALELRAIAASMNIK